VKLDPRKPDDPVVWSAHFRDLGYDGNGGIFSTPAISGDYVYVATNHGDLVALDRHTSEEAWRYQLTAPTWSSPVVVDDVLIQGDCAGVLHGFDISDPGAQPPELWNVRVDGCIEATPAVWEGMIYVGSRGGAIYGIGDPS
jgi:outer membrane protein assembly factor BamB